MSSTSNTNNNPPNTLPTIPPTASSSPEPAPATTPSPSKPTPTPKHSSSPSSSPKNKKKSPKSSKPSPEIRADYLPDSHKHSTTPPRSPPQQKRQKKNKGYQGPVAQVSNPTGTINITIPASLQRVAKASNVQFLNYDMAVEPSSLPGNTKEEKERNLSDVKGKVNAAAAAVNYRLRWVTAAEGERLSRWQDDNRDDEIVRARRDAAISGDPRGGRG
ncbi:hypothetical protein HK097_011251, partial [Rhizophlyctis rosea]